jgi:hypothetical protein
LSVAEAKNIRPVLIKYLLGTPQGQEARFDFAWAKELHREMFGEVWDWAGQFRAIDLNIGCQLTLSGLPTMVITPRWSRSIDALSPGHILDRVVPMCRRGHASVGVRALQERPTYVAIAKGGAGKTTPDR